MKKKSLLIYSILLFSLMLNLAYFKFDTFDYYLFPKIKKRTSEEKITEINDNTEKLIVQKSLIMLKSKNSEMIWEENFGLTKRLLSKNRHRNSNEFKYFNFPKAYLSVGLTEYAIQHQDSILLNEIISHFNTIIGKKGEPLFDLNIVDQVPFGLTSLKLFQFTGQKKYLAFSDIIYMFIMDNLDENQIINYRDNSSIYFVDTLGMVIPFLTEYYKIKKQEEILQFTKHQIEYFILNNGINSLTFMPVHGIKKISNIQVGSANWGRGIGWYFIALSHFFKETGEFKNEYEGLSKTLMGLKNSEGLWSQFPGNSDVFDASTTTMFMHSLKISDSHLFTKEKLLEELKEYIAVDGSILQTSGDTYTFNRYSNSFGKSELSQGFLLMILSKN